MQKIIALILFTLFSNISFSQSAKIEFSAKENTIDYGKVTKASDSGIRVFEFTNTGDSPLLITDVLSTTGFTIMTKPEAPIQPGKKGKIEVKYNMATGPIRKTITVETNASNYEGGRIALKIKGEVIAE
jgi:hypothetical protein